MSAPAPLAVVVPVWRPPVPLELERLRRSLTSLGAGARPILLAPSTLDVRDWIEARADVEVMRLDAGQFASKASYSALMLRPDVYDRLDRYRWMMICQPDAVVVNPPDMRTVEPFDYVGAPWRDPIPYRYSSRRDQMIACRPRKGLRVGNGGLSLRRVSALRRFVRDASGPIARLERNWPEDVLIAALGPTFGIRIPDAGFADRVFREETVRHVDPTTVDLSSVVGFHALERHNPELEHRILSCPFPPPPRATA